MKNFFNFNKTKLLLTLAGLLIFVLFLYALISGFAFKKEPAFKGNPLAGVDISKRTSENINIKPIKKGPITIHSLFKINGQLPKKAKVYSYTKENTFSENAITHYLNTLGLSVTKDTKQSYKGRVILANSKDKNLTIYPDKGEINYVYFDFSDQTDNFPADLNLQTYRRKVEEFTSSLGLSLEKYQETAINYRYSDGYETSIVQMPTMANRLEFSYESSIDGYPLIDKDDDVFANKVIIWIDSKYNIRRFYIQPIGERGTLLGEYKLKTKKQIEEEIKKGNVKLITTKNVPIGEDIISTVITEGELGYYAIDNKLLPVYILSGVSTTSKQKRGTGYLIIEAIDKNDL